MSELQIGLLVIGVVVVVGVYGYGFWQQRQYRLKFGSTFNESRDDVLYRPTASEIVGMSRQDVVVTDEKDAHRKGEDEPVCLQLDAATDYVVIISLKNPLNSDVLSPLWAQRFDFGKRINACGLNAATGFWERLIPEGHPSYTTFKVGLQLADRSGAVSEVRLNEFHDVLRDVAAHVQAEIILPSVADALKQAKKLDEFCASVDRMIGLNILPAGDRQLFGSEIAKVAEQHGMQLQADGTFHLVDQQGKTLFSLSSLEGELFQHHTLSQIRVRGLTVLLDVPRVEAPTMRFDEMSQLAKEIANELRATLVDDHRVTLGSAAIAHIRGQVAEIENLMSAGNIVAGSPQTLRLFS